jgi:hypothetical protein
MIKYAKIINQETGLCEVGLGSNVQFYQSIGMTQLDVKQSDIDNQWYLSELCPMKTDEQKELEEKERIAKLTCTKRVFALMLQELGITYTMLKQLIATNEQAQLEWDLCVELVRKNPLLDVMAMQLGITSEQLDGLFRYANGEITIEQFREMYIIPEPDVDNPEEVEEENPVDTEAESNEV